MKIVIVSSSLNPDSRSQLMARILQGLWSEESFEVELIDLREAELPLCDGGSAYGHPEVARIQKIVESADGFVFATPIYNFSINAALKNYLELVGRSMEGKVGGFLCSAGGALSYMSTTGFMNSVMLDFRMIILPRVVYATGGDWNGDELNETVSERMKQFADDFATLVGKLAN